MAKKKKRAGVGARAIVLARFLHPSLPIRERFPNNFKKHRIDGLSIVGQDLHRVVRRGAKPVLAYEFENINFPGTRFVAAARFANIDNESPKDGLFAPVAPIVNNEGSPPPQDSASEILTQI